jgi:O-antigen ligase
LRNTKTTLTQVVTSSGQGIAAHTEYSRLLAEHGLLGLFAIILLFFMAIRAFWHAPTAQAKGLTVAFMGWSLIEMLHQAMRLAAISYFFALPLATLEDEK